MELSVVNGRPWFKWPSSPIANTSWSSPFLMLYKLQKQGMASSISKLPVKCLILSLFSKSP